MPRELSAKRAWQEVGKNLFGVLAFSNARGEPRTAGVVYFVRDRRIWIATGAESWKARHVRERPAVSFTVVIPKSIPLMPWVPIPPATISFHGVAEAVRPMDAPEAVRRGLLRSAANDWNVLSELVFLRVEPSGRFLTYGVGVSLWTMRKPERARGFAPVA